MLPQCPRHKLPVHFSGCRNPKCGMLFKRGGAWISWQELPKWEPAVAERQARDKQGRGAIRLLAAQVRAETAALRHEQAARDQAATGAPPPAPRPLPPQPAPRSASALAKAHSGSWRGPGRDFGCSLADDESAASGPVCQHGGVTWDDHWSCCGERDEGAPCAEAKVGASAGNRGCDY